MAFILRLASRVRARHSSRNSPSYAIPANHRRKDFRFSDNLIAPHHRACWLSAVRSNAHNRGSYGCREFRCAAYSVTGTTGRVRTSTAPCIRTLVWRVERCRSESRDCCGGERELHGFHSQTCRRIFNCAAHHSRLSGRRARQQHARRGKDAS